MGAFQPDPLLVNFIFLREFLYLPALAFLALVRVLSARGVSRWAAALALLLALAGAAALIGPAAMGLRGGGVLRMASAAGDLAGGMALPLLASLPMLASGLLRGVRWRWIDVLHVLLLTALLVLWVMAR
ncbi:hypothetical protein M8756_02185 [Lutimaribacter sp. EGI FJ00015]|uniref:Uncharacterized protein n=1 Tax=Lutimaribacter degradans TaxID=2945989 RepID=A0ACC5ZRM0_9RHOB|nr:hypothetical protein [Lutimaribacter sp. EGI FJ00013]MCM2560951.1 hypothetical protein [Lutimaribacter sp. EGI FJ00013]MCO0612103.1 hypothetical protein [Lutimaribacter sp. EGI FJ00015]MCO0634777.1 hypothetical protein [Lutimaribacter sp. EGI FJ00014]